MNALQYFCELLDRLTLGLITLEPALVNFVIPAKIGGLFSIKKKDKICYIT